MTFTKNARNMTAEQANVIEEAIELYMAGVEITYNSVTDLYEVCVGCRHYGGDIFVPRLDANGMFQLTTVTPDDSQIIVVGKSGAFLRMVLGNAKEKWNGDDSSCVHSRTALALSYALGKDREFMVLFDAMWLLFDFLAEDARIFGLYMQTCPVPFYDNSSFNKTSKTPRKNGPCSKHEAYVIEIFLGEEQYTNLWRSTGEYWYFTLDRFGTIDYDFVPDYVKKAYPGDLLIMTVDKGNSWHSVHEELITKAAEMPLDGLAGLFA